MPPAGFEPTMSAGEQSQNDALDRAATGIGYSTIKSTQYSVYTQLFFSEANQLRV